MTYYCTIIEYIMLYLHDDMDVGYYHDDKSLLVNKDAMNDDVLTLDEESWNQHDIKMANILKVPSVNLVPCSVT